MLCKKNIREFETILIFLLVKRTTCLLQIEEFTLYHSGNMYDRIIICSHKLMYYSDLVYTCRFDTCLNLNVSQI